MALARMCSRVALTSRPVAGARFMVARGVTMENDKEILSDLDQQGGRRAVELEDEAQGVVSAKLFED